MSVRIGSCGMPYCKQKNTQLFGVDNKCFYCLAAGCGIVLVPEGAQTGWVKSCDIEGDTTTHKIRYNNSFITITKDNE